jgi:hypothetical protein
VFSKARLLQLCCCQTTVLRDRRIDREWPVAYNTFPFASIVVLWLECGCSVVMEKQSTNTIEIVPTLYG